MLVLVLEWNKWLSRGNPIHYDCCLGINMLLKRQTRDTKRSCMLLLSLYEAEVGLDEASYTNPVVKTLG